MSPTFPDTNIIWGSFTNFYGPGHSPDQLHQNQQRLTWGISAWSEAPKKIQPNCKTQTSDKSPPPAAHLPSEELPRVSESPPGGNLLKCSLPAWTAWRHPCHRTLGPMRGHAGVWAGVWAMGKQIGRPSLDYSLLQNKASDRERVSCHHTPQCMFPKQR